MLCLQNRNKVDTGNISINWNEVPAEQYETLGAMSVQSSLISDLELYRKRSSSGCVSVDAEKILSSVLTSGVNTGIPIVQSNVSGPESRVDLIVHQPIIDTSRTLLYMRMSWPNMLFITFGYFVSWCGLVLIFKNTTSFIRGR